MNKQWKLLLALVPILFTLLWLDNLFAQTKKISKLEIHYINVGQGGSTLIIGPNGTTILYDFGNVSGNRYIVPYLNEHLNYAENVGIDYAIVSHWHRDHIYGYLDFVDAGFDVNIANFAPGNPRRETRMIKEQVLDPALEGTTAGAFKPVTIGLPISLGDGAEAIAIASDGVVLGERKRKGGKGKKHKENDRSISLFINYGNFQYILDGDLGAGPEKCTQHETGQLDIQTRVGRALLKKRFITVVSQRFDT